MNVLAKGYRANVKYSIANELTILTMWTHVVTDLGERSCLAMCNKNYCQVSEVISFLCLIFFYLKMFHSILIHGSDASGFFDINVQNITAETKSLHRFFRHIRRILKTYVMLSTFPEYSNILNN